MDRYPEFSWGDLCKAYWFILGPHRWRWLLLFVVLFGIHFYLLVPPLIVGKIVDVFTGHSMGSPSHTFYLYAGILGVSYVLVSFIRLTLKNKIGNLQSEVIYQLKVRGFERLLDFSLAWHLEESAGAKAGRVQNGIESYRALNQRLSNEIMRSTASIVGIMLVFLVLRPSYVLFFLVYVVGFWVILLWFYKRIQHENDSYFLSLEKAGGSYVEGLSNILTIKTLGAGADFKKHVAEKERRTKEYEFAVRKLYNELWKTFQAFNGICYGAFLLLVGRDVIAQQIGPGSFVVFYGYLQNLINNANDMIDTYEVTLNSKSGIGRMMSVFWTNNTVTSGEKRLPKDWDNISLSNATFSYSTKSAASKNMRGVMDNLSLTIPRYAKIGIVGKTGSGKSTVAKILAGLYPLTSGVYTIGGVSFYDLTHEEQTGQLTLVLQETEIFNMSLKDNITVLRNVKPELLTQALEIAQLGELIDKLPQGLETFVGEKGYHLSGGERQRVGIARAICKDSPIIIFDEATSSLDSKTELLIQKALDTQLEHKTLVSIAHRVSTLQKTDVMYVFDEGKIVEQGTYAQLSKNTKSKFYELYKGQHSTRM